MQKPLTWMSILIVLAGQSLLQLLTSESDCAIFLDTSCCRALSVTWWLCDMTKSSHFICTHQIHATTGNKKVWKVPILSSQTDNAYLPAWEFFFLNSTLFNPPSWLGLYLRWDFFGLLSVSLFPYVTPFHVGLLHVGITVPLMSQLFCCLYRWWSWQEAISDKLDRSLLPEATFFVLHRHCASSRIFFIS